VRHTICSEPECSATIEWALTHKNRKPIPLDVGTNPEGNLAVVFSTDDGTKVVRVVPKAEREAEGLWPSEPRYMPHHATCVAATTFRRTVERINERGRVRRPKQ
jgi:hypothetical protein